MFYFLNLGILKNPSQTKQDIFVSTIISYCLTNKFFQDVNEFPNHIHQSYLFENGTFFKFGYNEYNLCLDSTL